MWMFMLEMLIFAILVLKVRHFRWLQSDSLHTWPRCIHISKFNNSNILPTHFQGQCFVALDPSVFAPGFEDRLSSLMNHCRSLDPVSVCIHCTGYTLKCPRKTEFG